MITLAETLIVPDITKPEFSCLLYIVLWKISKNYCMKCKQILFVLVKIQGQTHQEAASLETIQVLALFSQRCAVRTATV